MEQSRLNDNIANINFMTVQRGLAFPETHYSRGERFRQQVMAPVPH